MTNSNAVEQLHDFTNGVDVRQVMDVIGAIEADSSFAQILIRVYEGAPAFNPIAGGAFHWENSIGVLIKIDTI